jgi:hypothetical protein
MSNGSELDFLNAIKSSSYLCDSFSSHFDNYVERISALPEMVRILNCLNITLSGIVFAILSW